MNRRYNMTSRIYFRNGKRWFNIQKEISLLDGVDRIKRKPYDHPSGYRETICIGYLKFYVCMCAVMCVCVHVCMLWCVCVYMCAWCGVYSVSKSHHALQTIKEFNLSCVYIS